MRVDEKRVSVSPATVELKPAGRRYAGPIFTEHAVFLDGHYDARSRERFERVAGPARGGAQPLSIRLQRSGFIATLTQPVTKNAAIRASSASRPSRAVS
jgi:hypothetical protein